MASDEHELRRRSSAAARPTRARLAARIDGCPDALALLGLALIGAALLAVGTSPSPAAARNGLIAFDSNGDIWLADPDRNYQTTSSTTTAAQDTNPVWSPDGTRIAYWSNDNGTSSIDIVDAHGQLIHHVTRPAGLDLPAGGAPNWSPDGRQIAVVVGPDFSATVIIDAETGTASQLPIFARLPTWSPDGRHITWGSPRDAPGGVFVANQDGSGSLRVSAVGRPAGMASFESDSSRIVYAEQSPDGTDGDIVSVGLDGTDTRSRSWAGRRMTGLPLSRRTGSW